MRIEIYTNEPFKTAKKKAFEAFPNSDSIIFDKKEAPSKWISVKEKEAPCYDLVLITDGNSVDCGAIQSDGSWLDNGFLDEEPIFWMPLPQPPKEE